MPGNWAAERFPQFADDLRRLTEQHRELQDEPLHLAIAYDPGRDEGDVFLFEVVQPGMPSTINPDQDLFEVTYGARSGFPLGDDENLHLIVTTPEELSLALEANWPLASELRQAVQRGDFQILFQDETGVRLLESIRA